MTDRVKGFTVALSEDMRIDDAEGLMDAIRHLTGVMSVEPLIAELGDHIAYARARRELGDKLWAVLYPPKEKA